MYRMVLQVLDDFLIEDAKSVEELVLYWKMDGDYHWDMSRFLYSSSKNSALANAKQSYEAAMRWAENEKPDQEHGSSETWYPLSDSLATGEPLL